MPSQAAWAPRRRALAIRRFERGIGSRDRARACSRERSLEVVSGRH